MQDFNTMIPWRENEKVYVNGYGCIYNEWLGDSTLVELPGRVTIPLRDLQSNYRSVVLPTHPRITE